MASIERRNSEGTWMKANKEAKMNRREWVRSLTVLPLALFGIRASNTQPTAIKYVLLKKVRGNWIGKDENGFCYFNGQHYGFRQVDGVMYYNGHCVRYTSGGWRTDKHQAKFSQLEQYESL